MQRNLFPGQVDLVDQEGLASMGHQDPKEPEESEESEAPEETKVPKGVEEPKGP